MFQEKAREQEARDILRIECNTMKPKKKDFPIKDMWSTLFRDLNEGEEA